MITEWKSFKNFFVGNINAYGLQNQNGQYEAKREKITKELIEKHLNEEITIGSYNIYRKANRICCKWICLDIDTHSFKLENGTTISNSNQIKNLSFPVRLLKSKKEKSKTIFFTSNQLEEYYWEKSGLIVYEKVVNHNDKNQNLKEIFISNVSYYFEEKYRIEIDDKKKLENLVHEIEVFLKKFYNIPDNAICREHSGRGYHIWIKLEDLTTLKRAYDFKLDIYQKILQFFGIDLSEIFPKQEDVGDLYKCPYCKKKQSISVFENAEAKSCVSCAKEFKISQENKIEEGLGNYVKLPLSINWNTKTKCLILNDNFDLDKQESFKITELIKEIRKEKQTDKKHDSSETEVDLSKWKPLNQDDSYFYSKLRYCLNKIVKGRQTEGKHGHDMRRCLANELFQLKAPIETRVKAFAQQSDFDPETTLYQVNDLEMRARRANRFFVSKCSTIAEWGYCYKNCPLRYRSHQITEEEIAETLFKENEEKGIKGGWAAVRKILKEKINGKQGKEYIVKTTRSGTTTNVILETIENGKKLLMIAPTIKICEVTVKEALALTKKEVKLFRFGSNKDLCLLLTNRVLRIKSLARFPFLLKETCMYCEFSRTKHCNSHRNYDETCEDCKEINKNRKKCNWRRAIEDIGDYDIIYITIAKMYALTKTNDPEAQSILENIYNDIDIIFLDEISSVLDVGSESIVFKEKADKMYKDITSEINLSDRFGKEYEDMFEFMDFKLTRQQKKIWYALQDFVDAVDVIHSKWYDLHKNNEFHRLNSPLYRILKDIDKWYEDHDKRGGGDADWLGVYENIINYTEETDIYPRAVVDVMLLGKYPQFYIQYTSPLKYMFRMELMPAKPIKEFVDFLNMLSEDKQFFTTDATEPPIDVKKMFPNISQLIINDPMDTARSQIVIPDNQSVNISKMKSLQFYLRDIKKYVETYGNDNTMIICQNIITSRVLRKILVKDKHFKYLTYFRSPMTIGTPSECRTIITIGSPYPPKNSHRWLADLFINEGLADKNEFDIESLTQHLEYYNAKSQFFQAISRGKDPKGEVKSKVYTYGLNKFQVIQLLKFPIATPKINTEEKFVRT